MITGVSPPRATLLAMIIFRDMTKEKIREKREKSKIIIRKLSVKKTRNAFLQHSLTFFFFPFSLFFC
jgi:hypothetical protein